MPKDFPLHWPSGQVRTDPKARLPSHFKVDFRDAYDALLDEAEALHVCPGREIVVSTNIPLDMKDRPLVSAADCLGDPGVAVYVWRGDKPYVIACDSYPTVRDNMRAIWATIQALRTITRHGSMALFEQSMIGFCREIEEGETAPEVKLLAAGASGR